MAECIDRQAASSIPVLPKEHREYQAFNADDTYEKGWKDALECVAKIPPDDVRPVVFCKDCKHKGWIQEPCHGKSIDYCRILERAVDTMFFCAYGERKGGADVEGELAEMADTMHFPADWRDFLKSYSVKDSEEVYTNGADLIPSFRAAQMMEHYLAKKRKGKWIEDERGNVFCSACEEFPEYKVQCHTDFCCNCGADMRKDER